MTSFLTSLAFTQFDERRGRSEIIKMIQQHLSPPALAGNCCPGRDWLALTCVMSDGDVKNETSPVIVSGGHQLPWYVRERGTCELLRSGNRPTFEWLTRL